MSQELLNTLVLYRMINGDDRFRTTVISEAEVEEFDFELGHEAQRSKQEFSVPDEGGNYDSMMTVTYLKTALMNIEGSLVRSDSIAKLILSRYNREKVRVEAQPYSFVIDCLMAGRRASSSPLLYVFVAWLYAVSPVAKAWLDGNITFAELTAGSVIEQMQTLKRTKGKKWLIRKEVDPDYVINRMAREYGLSPDGYSASVDYFKTGANGVQVLDMERVPFVKYVVECFVNMNDEDKHMFDSVVVPDKG